MIIKISDSSTAKNDYLALPTLISLKKKTTHRNVNMDTFVAGSADQEYRTQYKSGSSGHPNPRQQL